MIIGFVAWRVRQFPKLNMVTTGAVVLVKVTKVHQLMSKLMLLTALMKYLCRKRFQRLMAVLSLRPMIIWLFPKI